MQSAGLNDNTGGLIVNVTALKSIYPIKGAYVEVSVNEGGDRRTVDSSYTDESGKSKLFLLPAPDKSLSENEGSSIRPYAVYDVKISADGFVDHIDLGVSVFAGVISVQNVDMLLTSAAGDNLNPRVFDENPNYEL